MIEKVAQKVVDNLYGTCMLGDKVLEYIMFEGEELGVVWTELQIEEIRQAVDVIADAEGVGECEICGWWMDLDGYVEGTGRCCSDCEEEHAEQDEDD